MTGHTRVLVVEDSSELRLALELGLRQEGWDVTTAVDGPDGISKFKITSPHLVVLDLRMPGMDGSEVCKAIRRTSSVPVIVYSAVDHSDEVNRAVAAGATDFVLKSSGLDELLRRVIRHLPPGGPLQANAPAQAPSSRTPGAVTGAASALSVLVLEPDVNVARLLNEEIEKLGHRVISLSVGNDRLPEGYRADIVVLDYAMPRWAGIDVVEEMSNSARTYPLGLIVASRSNPPELRRRVRACLMLDFIQKPWQRWELPLRLRTAVDTYARQTRRAA
jgi:DNA-binding response OmpR family regulator